MQENASHVISLPLFKLNLPAQSLFESQIKQLTEKSFALENRKLKIRDSKLIDRASSARLLIEGLFQASRCHTPDTAISIPLTQQQYKKGSQSKISQYAYRDVRACFDALDSLGWINFHKGFVDTGDTSYPTVLWAVGILYDSFKPHQNHWQKLTSGSDPVIVRKKNRLGFQEDVETPEGEVTERIRSNLTLINDIVPMLILTGARKREVLDARWEDFDIERRSWRIHTTKLGRPRHVPLSDGAVALLHSMKRFDDCPWAFPNPKTLKPYVSIFHSWNSARKAAGLKDVRMHDLRHSFASFLVNAGRSLYEVQHLLGHTQIKTTARLFDDNYRGRLTTTMLAG